MNSLRTATLLDEYFHEYSVYAPTPSNDTHYYIVQTHGEEATVNGMTAEEADDFKTCGYTEDLARDAWAGVG